MLLFALAYVGFRRLALPIAGPCNLPALAFAFSHADRRFA
jgi:hypothetical protein